MYSIIAVFTSDIENSTKLPAELKKAIYECREVFLKERESYDAVKVAIYRGDSFKCTMDAAEYGLDTLLRIKLFF